jgi:hypothetical protein
MLETLAVAALLHLPVADRVPPVSRSAPTAAVRFLKCAAAHETGRVRNPAKARNARSSAAGIFQMLSGTWRHYAQHVPSAKKYATADRAPASVQWEVALLAVKWHGAGNWRGTHCGYGT